MVTQYSGLKPLRRFGFSKTFCPAENRGFSSFIQETSSRISQSSGGYILQNGEIVEEGTHDELLNRQGHYKEIYDLQLRPQEEVLRDISIATGSVEGGNSQ